MFHFANVHHFQNIISYCNKLLGLIHLVIGGIQFMNLFRNQIIFEHSIESVCFVMNQNTNSKAFTSYALLMDHGFRQKHFFLVLYDDFYAIKHNGTKMCHQILHFLGVMLLCGCGFWVSDVIGPHVNMRIAIELT